MQALADSLKTDRHQVLACIKYEVLGKRPVYEAFKTFRERIGDAVMGYPEFEFWYMRFYNGDVDMDYDRSKDPKPLELMQLPLEIVEKVVEKLDLASRLITRNVCKPLRRIVDSSNKLKFKSLTIYGTFFSHHLFLGDHRIDYKSNKDKQGTTVICGERQYETKRVNTSDFAVSDLETLIKGHTMELDLFKVGAGIVNSSLFEKALHVFKNVSVSLNSRFKVKKGAIHGANPDLVVSCLTLLEPGILEDVHVNYISDEIVKTEQWRRAKIGRVRCEVNPTEINKFRHFEQFHFSINKKSAEIMTQLIETILTFPSFKKCEINIYSITIDYIAEILALPIQNEEIHVPIPDSTDILVIAVSTWDYAMIIRKRRL